MRLIDADALMKEFRDFVRDSNNSDFAPVPTWNDAVFLVGSAPTADIPERNVGKWVNDGKGLYKCTACGELWLHWWANVVPIERMYKELRFCPLCGAEMRERSEDAGQ